MLVSLIVATFAVSGAVSGPCDLVASPSGSDAAAGSVAAPFRTVQKLVDSLMPGQIGCLRGGTYSEDVRVGHGGQLGAPLTLLGFPGEQASLVGRLWVAQGADHVVVKRLHLDGRNLNDLPSPTINANDVVFTNDEVTNGHTAICFNVGSEAYGRANGTVISHNRIHGCGRLPPGNHDHGVYIATATDTRIEENLIYDNADRGVQLYPDAQGTTVVHNVIDGNGEGIIFSGDPGRASSYNTVTHNIISGSRVRADVESRWSASGPTGVGNVVNDNCLYGGRATVDLSSGGFTASGNLVADPGYADPARGDYTLRAGSPCASILTSTGPLEVRPSGARVARAPRARPAFTWLRAELVDPLVRELARVAEQAGAAAGSPAGAGAATALL